MNRVAASMTLSGDVTKGRALAKKWASAHPIRYSIADRETTLSRAVERDSSGSLSTGEAVAEITAELLTDAPRQAAAFREALAADDAALARRQAHTLKGASANVGAEALRAVAHAAELACAEGSMQEAAELAEQLDVEIGRLQRELGEKGGAS